MVAQEQHDPTFADFAAKHGITLTAALAPFGTVARDDRKWGDDKVSRDWDAYLYGNRRGVLSRLEWTRDGKGMIAVPDYKKRDLIDLLLTFERREPFADGSGKKVVATWQLPYGIGILNCRYTMPGGPKMIHEYGHMIRVYCPAPTVAEVLSHVVSTAGSIVDNLTYEEWAGEFGYDADSRKGERVYHACQQETAALRQFLGYAAFADALSGKYEHE
jgi:hypothetical protein